MSPSRSPVESSRNHPSESKIDVQISWKLFKDNSKAFFYNGLFAWIGFLLVVGIIIIIVLGTGIIQKGDLATITENWQFWLVSILLTIASFGILWIYVLLSCQYGLAHDIMTSGFMYTEFKSSFSYFRRYWWQYFILSFLSSLFSPFALFGLQADTTLVNLNPIAFIFYFSMLSIIHFLWYIIVIGSFPSVTHQGSLIRAFQESLRIFRRDFKRVISTLGCFYLVFYVPSYILVVPFYLNINAFLGTIWLPMMLGAFIGLVVFLALLGSPLLALIATRIYNSVDFKRFKSLIEPANKDN